MNKRLLIALLWAYSGWTLGALVAMATGANTILGPIVAAGAVLLSAVDPRLGPRLER